MAEKIDHKHPEFEGLCSNYQYPSTIHHLERDEHGFIKVVLWSEIDVERSATQRPLIYD